MGQVEGQLPSFLAHDDAEAVTVFLCMLCQEAYRIFQGKPETAVFFKAIIASNEPAQRSAGKIHQLAVGSNCLCYLVVTLYILPIMQLM